MEKYVSLKIGDKAYFMPWEDIIISDEIIAVHKENFYKNFKKYEATFYEFKHIQGKFRAYKNKEELEKVLNIIW